MPFFVFAKGRVAVQAIFFAEEEMPARLFTGELAAVFPGFPSRLNAVEDATVPRAAAQVPGKGLRHGLPIIRNPLSNQRRSAHEDSGNAVAALHPAFLDERVAQNPAHILRDTFQGDHVPPFHAFRLAQTGERWPPVRQDGAAAAGTLGSATVLGGNNAAFLAQYFEKMHPRLVSRNRRFPVQCKAYLWHTVPLAGVT